MKSRTVFDYKQTLEEGGVVVLICPATGNLPTRMGEDGWLALCKSTRLRESASGRGSVAKIRRRLNYCGICKGEIRPPGLEIISSAEMAAMKQQNRKEAIMGTAKKGTCDNCQRAEVTVQNISGDSVCPSCASLYGSIRNRPEATQRALRKLAPGLLEQDCPVREPAMFGALCQALGLSVDLDGDAICMTAIQTAALLDDAERSMADIALLTQAFAQEKERAVGLEAYIEAAHDAAGVPRDTPLEEWIYAWREDKVAMGERLSEIREELGMGMLGDVVAAVRGAVQQARYGRELADASEAQVVATRPARPWPISPWP